MPTTKRVRGTRRRSRASSTSVTAIASGSSAHGEHRRQRGGRERSTARRDQRESSDSSIVPGVATRRVAAVLGGGIDAGGDADRGALEAGAECVSRVS